MDTGRFKFDKMTNQIPSRIILHCAGTPNGVKIDIAVLRNDHIKNRGFSDIGYHLVIQPDGQVDKGRPLNVVGAHCEGHNTGSVGICLMGTNKFTQAQFDALRYQIDSLMLIYPIQKQSIFCHHQFDTAIKQGKTCPNISINDLLIWYYKINGEKSIAPYLLT